MPLQADAGREALRRRAPLRVPGAAERKSFSSFARGGSWPADSSMDSDADLLIVGSEHLS